MPSSKKLYLFRKMVKNINGDKNGIYPSLRLQNVSLLKRVFLKSNPKSDKVLCKVFLSPILQKLNGNSVQFFFENDPLDEL